MILRRLPDSRFSEVLPGWIGETAVVIGCGPSLTMEQVSIARDVGCKSIAVNDAYLWAPWALVHYAADSHWHDWHTKGLAKPTLGFTAEDVRARWAGFAGQKCSIQNSGANVVDEAVHILRNKTHPNHGVGLSTDPQELVTGRNSGFQSLNLAILAGSKRVLLLGFDGGPGHFHGGHPRQTPSAVFPMYRQAMSAAEHAINELGVTVINCSPKSDIDSWPKMPIEDALAEFA